MYDTECENHKFEEEKQRWTGAACVSVQVDNTSADQLHGNIANNELDNMQISN